MAQIFDFFLLNSGINKEFKLAKRLNMKYTPRELRILKLEKIKNLESCCEFYIQVFFNFTHSLEENKIIMKKEERGRAGGC